MKGKVLLLTGAAVGYVLGTRDGRERYEQIRSQAQRLWNDPKVQDARSHAQDAARERAPEMQQKLSDAASKAGDSARSRFGGEDAETSATGAAHQAGEPTTGATYG